MIHHYEYCHVVILNVAENIHYFEMELTIWSWYIVTLLMRVLCYSFFGFFFFWQFYLLQGIYKEARIAPMEYKSIRHAGIS